MSNIPRVYRSTDPGAPVLNGQPGSLLGVLNAVLVEGYGSGHDAKAPLGWIRAHSALNKAAYRNDPVRCSGQFLLIDDTSGTVALIDGYEAMSGIDTGSVRFDTVSSVWPKAQNVTTQRPWFVVGTESAFYISIQANSYPAHWFAGDYKTLKLDEISPFGYSRSNLTTIDTNAYSGLLLPQNHTGIRVSRSMAGVPGAGHELKLRQMLSGYGAYGSGGFSYPLPTTNGMFLERAILNETSAAAASPPRGTLPGFWAPDHNVSASYLNGQVYDGFESLPEGTQLLAIRDHRFSPPPVAFLDITNPW